MMGSDDVYEPGTGAKIGRYELRKKLAAGGMAEIYLARVTGVGGFAKDVVLKRILPQLAESEQFFRMFLDEARIAATLAHPNVVQVYDAGESDGQYYIAMEYLDGGDLATLRRHLGERDQRIKLDHLVYCISGVCAGLHYAHEQKDSDGSPLGIVHRDVTPQNIFVTRDGGVKVVDFGIAKASNRLSRTTYGTLKGKLAYMAPEQCQGEEVDRRADVYAIGIVLYELSTGENPHRGGAEYAMMKEIVEGTIAPPSSIVPDYPPGLEAIVMKAVAKHPDARYQSAREMQLDIEKYVRAEQLPVSALSLSDYVVPLLEEIREEQDSRSKRFADEVDAYEEYLAGKPQPEPKRRRRAEAAAAADAEAANKSIEGLLSELREQDKAEKSENAQNNAARERQAATTIPNTAGLPVHFDDPIAPGLMTGVDGVNVRTGSRTVGIILGVVLGIGGLVGYLAVSGRLNTSGGSADAPVDEAPLERAVPERGTVSVESQPDGATVWQYVGRTPIEHHRVDTAAVLKFRIEGDGYQSQVLEIKPDDWRGEEGNKLATTEVSLTPLHQLGKPGKRGKNKDKTKPLSWIETASVAGDATGKASPGLLTIRSRPKAVGVWLFVGTTPNVEVADVSTRSGVELRFDREGYASTFVEVTERSYTEAGKAAVKVTLLK